MSCYLTAFVQTNQILYMNFPDIERESFPERSKSTLPSSVALPFRNLVNGTFDPASEWFLEVQIFSVFVRNPRVSSSNPGYDDFSRLTIIFCILMKFAPFQGLLM